MIAEIRVKIERGELEFSEHALDQSILRQISVLEVLEAAVSGEIIENYPDDKYGPSCLILGWTTLGRPLQSNAVNQRGH